MADEDRLGKIASIGQDLITTQLTMAMETPSQALESGWVETIYEDDEARLLKIREVKGDAPDVTKDDAPETDEEKKILDEQEKNTSPPDPDEEGNG